MTSPFANATAVAPTSIALPLSAGFMDDCVEYGLSLPLCAALLPASTTAETPTETGARARRLDPPRTEIQIPRLRSAVAGIVGNMAHDGDPRDVAAWRTAIERLRAAVRSASAFSDSLLYPNPTDMGFGAAFDVFGAFPQMPNRVRLLYLAYELSDLNLGPEWCNRVLNAISRTLKRETPGVPYWVPTEELAGLDFDNRLDPTARRGKTSLDAVFEDISRIARAGLAGNSDTLCDYFLKDSSIPAQIGRIVCAATLQRFVTDCASFPRDPADREADLMDGFLFVVCRGVATEEFKERGFTKDKCSTWDDPDPDLL